MSRGPRRPLADVWTWTLRQTMPVIAVPLSASDGDVPLDLQAAFAQVYSRGGYDYVLDYSAALDPPLGADDAAWVESILTDHAG